MKSLYDFLENILRALTCRVHTLITHGSICIKAKMFQPESKPKDVNRWILDFCSKNNWLPLFLITVFIPLMDLMGRQTRARIGIVCREPPQNTCNVNYSQLTMQGGDCSKKQVSICRPIVKAFSNCSFLIRVLTQVRCSARSDF